jgi:hypothetical protein
MIGRMHQVAYHDALLPLFDAVIVANSEWHFVDEKLEGLISQVGACSAPTLRLLSVTHLQP